MLFQQLGKTQREELLLKDVEELQISVSMRVTGWVIWGC